MIKAFQFCLVLRQIVFDYNLLKPLRLMFYFCLAMQIRGEYCLIIRTRRRAAHGL